MRKVVVSNMVSLDGYYTGPGDDVTVMPMDDAFDSYNAERLDAADTLLLGAKSYGAFRGVETMTFAACVLAITKAYSRRQRARGEPAVGSRSE